MAAIFWRCSAMVAANSSDVPERDTVPRYQTGAECRVGGNRLHIAHNPFPDIRRHVAPSEETDAALERQIRISLAVGTSGTCGERSRLVTKRILAVPA